MPKLPCSPSESCRLIRRKVAAQSTPKLPPPSERSDATCFMGNLISPGSSMPLHMVPPEVSHLSTWWLGPSPCFSSPLRPTRVTRRSLFGPACPYPPLCAPAPPVPLPPTRGDAGAQSRAVTSYRMARPHELADMYWPIRFRVSSPSCLARSSIRLARQRVSWAAPMRHALGGGSRPVEEAESGPTGQSPADASRRHAPTLGCLPLLVQRGVFSWSPL